MAIMSTETIELRDRIEALLGTRDVHPNDRERIQGAFVPDATWGTVPQDIRDLIEQLERDLPVQSWTDPDEVPTPVMQG